MPKSYHEQGLLSRYKIERSDGKPEDPEAKFFVLRYDKNDAWGMKCRAALRSFAGRIRDQYPALAADLIADVIEAERGACG